MATDLAAWLHEDEEMLAGTVVPFKPVQRNDKPRRHVLNRMTQDKSGRLSCNDDWDVEIPALEIYAAR
jgi:hypothetical protein